MLNSQKDKLQGVRIILLAPYTQLYPLKQIISQLSVPLELGAQSVSPYPEGAYTGQISAGMLKELVNWVIVGHSERRKFFHETDTDLAEVTKQAKAAGLSVIYCVSDDIQPVPPGVDVAAYEPVWAIGTGKTDTPENADGVIRSIKTKTGIVKAIYGGSVVPDNVLTFVNQPDIDGVLPGGASLDPEKFYSLIINAVTRS